MNTARAVVLGWSLWLPLAPSPARAAEPTSARLDYEAPEGCPTRPAFVAAVSARGGSLDDTPAPQTGRVMVVSIRKDDDRFTGTFQVRDQQGATSRREVSADTCAAVADALAVVTAIELRPARTDAAPIAPGPPVSVKVEHLRAHTPAFPPRHESVAVGAGTMRFDLQSRATAYGGVTVGVIPSVLMPRYDLSLLSTNFVTTPEGAQRINGLALDLRLGVLGKATYRAPGTTTDAVGFSFGADFCRSPLYDTAGFVLLICAEYGGGLMALTTRGMDGNQIQSKSVGFGTASLGAELQYNLGSLFQVGVKVGGGFTIGQLTAERSDGSRIFASSPWSAYALLGVGVHY